MQPSAHDERHYTHRIGWLRAAVLGANDGIVSTASLVVGVAAAESAKRGVLVAGMAGLMAGAMSMAAGEYVSVSSQSDTEKADLERETRELRDRPDFELEELRKIYVERGLDQPHSPSAGCTEVAGRSRQEIRPGANRKQRDENRGSNRRAEADFVRAVRYFADRRSGPARGDQGDDRIAQ